MKLAALAVSSRTDFVGEVGDQRVHNVVKISLPEPRVSGNTLSPESYQIISQTCRPAL
jgi:hypothetical protein